MPEQWRPCPDQDEHKEKGSKVAREDDEWLAWAGFAGFQAHTFLTPPPLPQGVISFQHKLAVENEQFLRVCYVNFCEL